MTPKALARRIQTLPPQLPVTKAFENALRKNRDWNRNGVWYTSQKEHWLGWLSEYDGPGYYGRKEHRRSAEFIYNHVVCPPMVLYLGEAVGVPTRKVVAAKNAALSTGSGLATKSAAIRRILSWSEIEEAPKGY